MGCDGGTIPRRDELVRVKKKPEQKDKEAELAYRWKHCSIRQLPLQAPIVACGLGRLYSKEAVLEGLLDRTTLPESASHIKNLKDVKNLNLTPNPAFEGDKARNGGYIDDGRSPYICPVIGLEMNGKYKFCFLWNCGCVMSERALKQINTTVCHKCQKPFTETDVVVMNAQDDDLKLMEDNIILRKSERKSKKRSHEAGTSNTASNAVEVTKNEDKKIEIKQEVTESEHKKDKKVKQEEVTVGEHKKDKKVKQEEVTVGEHKRIKKVKQEKVQTSKSKIKKDPQDPAYKKATEDYSVAQDPKASEVLKSIFTSHKTASQQTRAHWVTYNPFYN